MRWGKGKGQSHKICKITIFLHKVDSIDNDKYTHQISLKAKKYKLFKELTHMQVLWIEKWIDKQTDKLKTSLP